MADGPKRKGPLVAVVPAASGRAANGGAVLIDVDGRLPALSKPGAAVSSGFLVDEGIRFFNYGTLSTHQGLKRSHPPLTPETLTLAIESYCTFLTPALYRHVERIYDYEGGHEGLCSKKGFSKIVTSPEVNDYVKVLGGLNGYPDKYQLGLIVPRLLCDDWATTAARMKILDLRSLVRTQVSLFEHLTSYTQSIAHLERDYRQLLSIPKPPRRNGQGIDAELETQSALGNGRTLVPAGAAGLSFLSGFSQGLIDWFGIPEKIAATLSVLATLPGTPQEAGGPTFSILSGVDAVSGQVYSELNKLANTSVVSKGNRVSTIDDQNEVLAIWLQSLRSMKSEIVVPLLQLGDKLVPEPQLGPVQSDLIWALILTDVLIAWLTHIQLQCVLAALPFRQIYEGGDLVPLAKDVSVGGVLGVMAIALWEYLSPVEHPHGLARSARNSFTSYLGKEPRNQPPLDAKDAERLHVSSLLGFLNAPAVSLDTVVSEAAKRLRSEAIGGDGDVRTVDTVAAVNRCRLPAQNKRERKEDWRKRVKEELAKTARAVPAGPFPIGKYEVNPVFHPSFYKVSGAGRGAGRAERGIFTGWGGHMPQMAFGAKVEAHVQAYVFGWLHQQGLRDAEVTSDYDIVFTCGSAPYGGKFPPHITHRDGFGFDFSLKSASEPIERYYWSVFWPYDTALDDDQTTFAQKYGNRDSPVGDLAKEVRAKLTALQEKDPARFRQFMLKLAQQQKPPSKRPTVKKTFDHLSYQISDEATTNGSISKVLPREALLAAWNDHLYAKRPGMSPAGVATGRAIVFREYMRDYLLEISQSIRERFDEKKSCPVADSDAWFLGLEALIDDWPVMPVPDSHRSHHVGHVALLLSFPREIIWGAPLYHVRALRAIATAFAADAIPHPFEDPSKGQSVVAEFDGVHQAARKTGAMPLPELMFLPYNHHHHWHVNFLKAGPRSHHAHLVAAMPYWKMLGVDLAPVRTYLETMLAELKRVDTRGHGSAVEVAKQIETVIEAIGDPYEKLQVDPTRATELRKRIFLNAARYAEDDSAQSKMWRDRKKWPTKDSALEHFVRLTGDLETVMRAFSRSAPADVTKATADEIDAWITTTRTADDPEARAAATNGIAQNEERDPDLQDGANPANAPLEEGRRTREADHQSPAGP